MLKNHSQKVSAFLKKAFKRELYNVVLLSTCFMLIFTAFNTSQNFMTTLHPNIGTKALALLNGAFSASTLFAPIVVTILGPKISMVLGSISYIVFTALMGFPYDTPLLIVSLILGLGSSILWIAQSQMMTRCAFREDNMGLYSGIFFGIFQLYGIIGNGLLGILQVAKVQNYVAFLILAAMGTAGAIMLLFLLHIPPIEELEEKRRAIADTDVLAANIAAAHESVVPVRPETPSDTNHLEEVHVIHEEKKFIESDAHKTAKASADVAPPKPSFKKRVQNHFTKLGAALKKFFYTFLRSIGMFFNFKFLLLVPFFLTGGFLSAFFAAFVSPKAPAGYLTWCFMAFAVVDFLASLILGKLSDKLGTRLVIWITCIAMGATMGLSFPCLTLHPSAKLTRLFFITFIVWGISDAGFNTQVYAVLNQVFKGTKNLDASFISYRLIASLSSVVGLVLSMYLTRFVVQIVLCSLIIAAVVGYTVLDVIILASKLPILKRGRRQSVANELPSIIRKSLELNSMIAEAGKPKYMGMPDTPGAN